MKGGEMQSGHRGAGDSETGCSAEEWREVLVLVLNYITDSAPPELQGVFSPSSEDIAVIRKAVAVAQDLNDKVVSSHPQAASLQRPHAELTRLMGQMTTVSRAFLRQSELSVSAAQSDYGKRQMGEHVRAENETGQALAEITPILESFAVAMTELAANDKNTYGQLNLPPDMSFVET